jgi:septal ring factor EnvC (AmiA/AmiB activator)
MDNKYINAYVDIAIGTIHEYLAANIQLKAQNKLSNDLISEKDKIIASLQSDILSIDKNNNKNLEDSYNAMKTKVSHMETLTKQLIDMKREIGIRDDKIKDLEDKLAKLNKKSKNKPLVEIMPAVKDDVNILADKKEIVTEKLPIDDF